MTLASPQRPLAALPPGTAAARTNSPQVSNIDQRPGAAGAHIGGIAALPEAVK